MKIPKFLYEATTDKVVPPVRDGRTGNISKQFSKVLVDRKEIET